MALDSEAISAQNRFGRRKAALGAPGSLRCAPEAIMDQNSFRRAGGFKSMALHPEAIMDQNSFREPKAALECQNGWLWSPEAISDQNRFG